MITMLEQKNGEEWIFKLKPFYMMKKIRTFILGERIKGEPIRAPKFRTTYPDNQPSEHEWYKEFRVSCLHGKQQVFIR